MGPDAEALIFFAVFIFGTTLGGLVLWKLFNMVRSSIKKHKNIYNEETFERLAEAFIKHKKNSEERFQNIEAIIANDNSTSSKKVEEPKTSIEIEDKKEQKSESGDGNLSNMLRE